MLDYPNYFDENSLKINVIELTVDIEITVYLVIIHQYLELEVCNK